jgi:hypothetical protein
MSADSVHVLVTVGVIALMFAWVPLLRIVCPNAWRVEDSPKEKKKDEKRPSVAPLSSRRFAEQSKEFLHALSTRERDSGSGSSDVPPGSCAQ